MTTKKWQRKAECYVCGSPQEVRCLELLSIAAVLGWLQAEFRGNGAL